MSNLMPDARTFLQDPHLMISVDYERPPFAFVLIDGTAAVEELSPKELLPWTTRIASRYVATGAASGVRG